MVVQQLHGLLRREGLPVFQQVIHLEQEGVHTLEALKHLKMVLRLCSEHYELEHTRHAILGSVRTSATSKWLYQVTD